ncbi:MAG: DUF3971 domain-containing protein [Halioglobus sp.]|nr:DUF3971 domain-containing protein [Halioglobus sp.]
MEKTFFHRLSRLLWGLIVLLLVVLAVYVSVGRTVMANIEPYRQAILQELNVRVPFNIAAQSVRGEWRAFTPFLVLGDLRLSIPGSGEPPLELAEGRVGIDVWGSLASRSLRVTHLELGGLDLHGEFTADRGLVISGFGGGAGEAGAWLRAFLLNIESMILRGNRLSLQLPGGEQRELDLDLVLTRSGNDRSIEAKLASTRGAAATVRARGSGDPLDPQSFSGDLYLDIETPDLGAVRDLLAGDVPPVWADGELDLRLWLSWERGAPSVQASLVGRDLMLSPRQGNWRLPLQRLSMRTRLGGDSDHWTVHAADVEIVRDGIAIALPRLQLDAWGSAWRARATDVALEPLSAFIAGMEVLPGNAREVVAGLGLAGHLQALQVSVGDIETPTDDWELEASFEDMALAPYRGAPGGSGLSGYAHLTPGGGSVLIDAPDVTMEFPGVYRHPLSFEELRGSLDIAWDAEAVGLSSGLISARADEGEARAVFGLSIPLAPTDTGPQMELLVGLVDSHSRYREKYVPYLLDQGLRDWLSRSIGEGEVEKGAFLFRGSLRDGAGAGRTVQLALDVADIGLDYHPDWPPVEVEEGLVLVDDTRVSVWAGQGAVLDSTVSDLSVETWLDKARRVNLLVNGTVQGPAADGLEVVNTSPLGGLAGDTFADWQLSGQLTTDLQLHLQLGESAAPPEVDLHSRLRDVDLRIVPGNLPVEELNGEFSYSTDAGFDSRTLEGRLWGERLSARISQLNKGRSVSAEAAALEVEIETAVAMSSIREWLQLEQLAFASGATPVNIGVRVIPEKPPLLTVDSNLRGVALDMPEPWAKEAADSGRLHVAMRLAEDPRVLSLSFNDELNLDLDLRGDMLHGAALGVMAEAPAIEAGALRVAGHAPLIEGDQWIQFIERYFGSVTALTGGDKSGSDAAPATGGPAGGNGLELHLEQLHAGTLVVAGQRLREVELSLHLDASRRELAVITEWLRGRGVYDTTDGTAQVAVQYLDLSGLDQVDLFAAARSDDGEQFSMAQMPPVEVTLDHIHQAEKRLGELSFSLDSIDGALVASKITGELARIGIAATPPAELTWYTGPDERTELQGRLAVGNLGTALGYFGYEKIVETRGGTVDVALDWQGSPAAFSLADLDGKMHVDIGEGTFTGAPSSASGALRVVSILNLADILRRLSLAHMFDTGIPFDGIEGDVRFDKGRIEVPEMQISGGSSFQFSGVSEVNSRTLDGELVATLPVAQNLPWVAALAANLPVAAGVFVVSKIFDKQMDRLSSAVYSIGGTWEDPEVRFDRLFDNTSRSLPPREQSAPDAEAEPADGGAATDSRGPDAGAGEQAARQDADAQDAPATGAP